MMPRPGRAQISIPEALELLLDAVLNPKLQQWEVEKVATRLEADLEAFKQDPHACLLEVGPSIRDMSIIAAAVYMSLSREPVT